jgi:hypothetical protein
LAIRSFVFVPPGIEIFASNFEHDLLHLHARLFEFRLKLVVLVLKFLIGDLQLGANLVRIDE